MNNIIKYKGYTGRIKYSENKGLYVGEIVGLDSTISFCGKNQSELMTDFEAAIEDYLEMCDACIKNF